MSFFIYIRISVMKSLLHSLFCLFSGITALEMAEGKPPYGDIHPMRVCMFYQKNQFILLVVKETTWLLPLKHLFLTPWIT